MGLFLEVGMLADLRGQDEEAYRHFLDQFNAISVHLAKSKLALYLEPELVNAWGCQMYGYSGLHYLRRIAAHLALKKALPEPGNDDAANDPVLQAYYKRQKHKGSFEFTNLGFDHLILHSDCDGFYLPIDFERVLYIPTLSDEFSDWTVGSAIRLEQECKRLASILEIPEHLHAESEELWDAVDSETVGSQRWQRYGIESYSCVCLLDACRKSRELKAAIVFT